MLANDRERERERERERAHTDTYTWTIISLLTPSATTAHRYERGKTT
jgi:hypothetical protein